MGKRSLYQLNQSIKKKKKKKKTPGQVQAEVSWGSEECASGYDHGYVHLVPCTLTAYGSVLVFRV